MIEFGFLIVSAILSIVIEYIASKYKMVVNSAVYWFLGSFGLFMLFAIARFSPSPVGVIRKVLAWIILFLSMGGTLYLENVMYNKYKKIMTGSFPWGLGVVGTLMFFAIGHFNLANMVILTRLLEFFYLI